MPLAAPEIMAPEMTAGSGKRDAWASVPELAFDHLGLIVPDLEQGRAFLQTALGISRWSAVVDDDCLGVTVQFGAAPTGAGPVYELVAPCGSGSPIAGQLGRGKGVLNHLAYRTHDLEKAAAHLRATGCFPTAEPQPARAYGGALVQFWVSPLRFLIELIAKPDHQHVLLSQSAGSAEAESQG